MAAETGIAPSVLLAEPPDLFWAVVEAVRATREAEAKRAKQR